MSSLAAVLALWCSLWSQIEGRTYGQWTSFGNWSNKIADKSNGVAANFRLLYSWKSPDFYLDDALRKDMEAGARTVIPENNIMLDVDAFTRKDGVKVLYITTPSVMKGNPYSLGFLANVRGRNSSQLRPFPNAKWHRNDDNSCKAITSAFRTKVDRLGRLWVLDTGKLEAFAEPKQACSPQILAFDLNNDAKLIHRYVLPADHFSARTLFVTIEVEVLDDGRTWVYLTDPVTFSMVVYSVDKKSSHVIKQPYFYPDPKYGHYSLNGVNFTLMDGLFSAVVVPGKARSGADNMLYFHSLSAGREFRAKTRLLKDPEASTKNFWEYEDLGYQRKFHASAMAVNSNGIMVFPNLEDNSIIAWNSNMPYRPENFRVIAKDVENLQFPSGVKIIGNELYLLTSRIQNVMVGNIPKDEVNYRVLVGDLEKMLVNGRPYRETSSPSNEFADRFGSEPEDVASTTTDQTTAEGSTTDTETGSDPPENAVWEVVRNGKNGN